MAKAWTPAIIAAAEANKISRRFLVGLETDLGWLRFTDSAQSLTYDGDVYEGAVDKWTISGALSTGANLVPEAMTITFDGAYQYDNSSIVGQLLDRQWHRKEVLLVGLLLRTDTGALLGDFDKWRGRMNTIAASDQIGAKSQVVLQCETGSFHALSANNSLAADADQRLRSSTDTFFENAPLKMGQRMPFGLSYNDIPGSPSSGSGGSTGGGVITAPGSLNVR